MTISPGLEEALGSQSDHPLKGCEQVAKEKAEGSDNWGISAMTLCVAPGGLDQVQGGVSKRATKVIKH